MKQTTMCLLSGFFGALFAVACGVVDGAGDKEANANPLSLQIKSISFDCPIDYDSNDYLEFADKGNNGEIIVSLYSDNCSENSPTPNKQIYHYIE